MFNDSVSSTFEWNGEVMIIYNILEVGIRWANEGKIQFTSQNIKFTSYICHWLYLNFKKTFDHNVVLLKGLPSDAMVNYEFQQFIGISVSESTTSLRLGNFCIYVE